MWEDFWQKRDWKKAVDMVQGRPESGLNQVGNCGNRDHLFGIFASFQKNSVTFKAHSQTAFLRELAQRISLALRGATGIQAFISHRGHSGPLFQEVAVGPS